MALVRAQSHDFVFTKPNTVTHSPRLLPIDLPHSIIYIMLVYYISQRRAVCIQVVHWTTIWREK